MQVKLTCFDSLSIVALVYRMFYEQGHSFLRYTEFLVKPWNLLVSADVLAEFGTGQ